MPEDKEPIPQFAARIKAKYPQYKDVNDTLLVQKIVEKYPEYESQVDLSGVNGEVKKKVSSPVLTNGGTVGSSNGLPEGRPATDDYTRRKAQWEKAMNPKVQDFDPNDPVKSVSNSIFSKTVKFNPPKSESTNQHYLSGQHQVEKQIEEDKNNEKITPHIAAQAMKNVNETTFPTAASARKWQYQQGKQFDPNNETDKLAKSVINEHEKVRGTIVNNDGDLTKSAIDYYSDADPQLKVLKDAGKEPPPEVKANLLYKFLQDKNVQELANENQDFKNKYQEEKTGFFENHPDLRATKILNQIAQGREDYGYNNPFLNLVGTESSDKVIENLSMRGQIDKWDKDFYYKYVRPMIGTHMRQIPTSGLIETAFQGAAKGLEDIPKGVYEASGLRNAATSKADRVYQNLEEDAKQLSVNPSGVNYISHTIGNLAGVLAPISGGAKALKAINLVKDADAANNIAMGLTFYHDIQKQAEENNPDDPLGNHLSALIQSAIFMKINPAFKGLSKAIMRDAQPEIESTLNKLKTEAISPDAAKESIVHEVLGKAVDVGKKSLDMATQMSVATGLNHAVDGIFSGKFDADKTVQDMAKTFESMLIGGIGLNVATMGGRTKAEGISSEPLNEKETAAIDAIKGKEFTALKPYTDILHDENSSVQDKRAALRGISDQLLAPSGAERAGAELGQKASVAIEDLGHEAPKESEALANLQEPLPDQVREVDNGMTPPVEKASNTDNVGGDANKRLKDLGVKEGDVVEDKDGNKFQVKELFTDPYLPGQQRYKLQTEDGKIKIEGQTSGYKKSDGFNVTDTGAAEVKKVVDDFDSADQTSIQDLVDSIDGIEELPEKIRDAVDKYRQEQDYDTKLSGRGDMETADAAFEKTVRDFVKQSLSKPSTPTVQKTDNVGGDVKLTQRQLDNREKSRIDDVVDRVEGGDIKGSNISVGDKDLTEHLIDKGLDGRESYVVKDMVERLIKPLQKITDNIDPQEVKFLTENVEDINSVMEGLEDARSVMFTRNKDIVDNVNKEAKRLLDYYSDKNNLPDNKLENEKTFAVKVDLLKKFLNGDVNYLDLTKFGVEKKAKDYYKPKEQSLSKPSTPTVQEGKGEAARDFESEKAKLTEQRDERIAKEGKPELKEMSLSDKEYAKLPAEEQNNYVEWEKKESALRKLIDCLWKPKK